MTESPDIELYVTARIRQKELTNELLNDRIHRQLINAKSDFDNAESEMRRERNVYLSAIKAWETTALNKQLTQVNQECDRLKLLVGGISNSESAISNSSIPETQSFNSRALSYPFIVPLRDDNEIDDESDHESLPDSNDELNSKKLHDMSTIGLILKNWPRVSQAFQNYLNPERTGACPRHSLQKLKCKGRDCEWWRELIIDLSRDSNSRTCELDTMEHELDSQRLKDRIKYQRKKQRLDQASDNESQDSSMILEAVDGITQISEAPRVKENAEASHIKENQKNHTTYRRKKQRLNQVLDNQNQDVHEITKNSEAAQNENVDSSINIH